MNTKNDKKVDFGFKKVFAKDKSKLVGEVFDNVSNVYDIMNDVMSLGIHRLWKKEFCDSIIKNSPSYLLDVGGGTGDITFRCIKKQPEMKVMSLDINKNMLYKGRERSFDNGCFNKVQWVVANAENLPLKDNQFDAYSIAFCIRNVTDIDKALKEAHRVLRRGGKFYCLEFSKVNNEMLSKLYKLWSFNVIPKLGGMIAKNKSAYEYLVESIQKFPAPTEFSNMIEQAGFKHVEYKPLSFGVACIHTATKL